MKYTIVVAALLASVSVAQDLTQLTSQIASLPPCGQTCISNMLAKAPGLDCKDTTDVVCLCSNSKFRDGIHDCTYESCPSDVNKQSIIDTGNGICQQALAAASSVVSIATATTASGASTKSVTATVSTPSGTNTILVATAKDTAGNNITSTIGPLVSGGVRITTTDGKGSTFVTTASAIPTGASSGNSSFTNGTSIIKITTTNSLGSTVVATSTSVAATTTKGTGTATVTGTGTAAPSSTKTGAAVRIAAVGFAGVAGFAALALL